MHRNYLTWCLFVTLYSFIASTAGRKAIIGGEIIENYRFRYQVLLKIGDNNRVCGGGILDNRHILTAASCVIQNNGDMYVGRMTVVAGMNRIHEGQIFLVGIIRVPPQYIARNPNAADFAVVKVSQSMTSRINPRKFARIHLPIINDTRDYAGEIALIAGFGSGEHRSETLLFAEAEILTHQECQEIYNSWRLIGNNQLCARIKRHKDHYYRDVCTGDEGGPLVLRDGTVIGVLTVISPRCDEETQNHLPAIYTRVSSYRQYIFNYTHSIGGTIHRVPISIGG